MDGMDGWFNRIIDERKNSFNSAKLFKIYLKL